MTSHRKKRKMLEKNRVKQLKRWRKLLKAELKQDEDKVIEHEVKLISLELEERRIKDDKQ